MIGKQSYSESSWKHFCTWNPRGRSTLRGPGPGQWTPVIYRLDGQAALKRGLSFVIIVNSFFLIPASLRQTLASLLLHHSARFPRPSARFVLPSARFLIPDSYLPPPHIAQGALRRALCYISCLPPPDSCFPPPASYLPPRTSSLPPSLPPFLRYSIAPPCVFVCAVLFPRTP